MSIPHVLITEHSGGIEALIFQLNLEKLWVENLAVWFLRILDKINVEHFFSIVLRGKYYLPPVGRFYAFFIKIVFSARCFLFEAIGKIYWTVFIRLLIWFNLLSVEDSLDALFVDRACLYQELNLL